MKRIVTFVLAVVMLFTCFPSAALAAENKTTIGMADVGAEGYQTMTSSQSLLDVIKSMEGFSETPYWDYGQYTIGFGCNASQEEGFLEKVTVEEAEELLRRELKEKYELQVNSFCAKIGKQPNQHQFDALVSFTYNCGDSWTRGSRLATWLKDPTTELELVSSMGAWKRAGGEILYALVQRRIQEAIMFLKGEYSLTQNLSDSKKLEWKIQSELKYISPSALPYYASATFKLDGGKVDAAYSDAEKYDDFVLYYAKDSYYSPLPLPVKEGYTFAGWKITRIGNNKTDIGSIVTIETKVEKNVELTAQWVEGNVTIVGSDKFSGVSSSMNTNGSTDSSVIVPEVNIPAAAQPFEDVYTTSWFRDNVVYVYENGYMNGISDTIFDPSGQMTRGMMVTVLYRMDGSPTIESSSHGFTDVADGKYYSEAVAWAKENGIVKGMSDTEFAPGDPVTRQQAVTIFYRYCVDYKGGDGSKMAELGSFPDASEVKSWALDGMKWAVANGVITGTAENNGDVLLNVNGILSRSQCAALIQRCCTQILTVSHTEADTDSVSGETEQTNPDDDEESADQEETEMIDNIEG